MRNTKTMTTKEKDETLLWNKLYLLILWRILSVSSGGASSWCQWGCRERSSRPSWSPEGREPEPQKETVKRCSHFESTDTLGLCAKDFKAAMIKMLQQGKKTQQWKNRNSHQRNRRSKWKLQDWKQGQKSNAEKFQVTIYSTLKESHFLPNIKQGTVGWGWGLSGGESWHHLSEVIYINVNSHKSCWDMYPCYVMKTAKVQKANTSVISLLNPERRLSRDESRRASCNTLDS